MTVETAYFQKPFKRIEKLPKFSKPTPNLKQILVFAFSTPNLFANIFESLFNQIMPIS